MSTPRTKRIEVSDRRARAVRMRASGQPWQTIADTLGYASPGAACTDVKRALEASLADQQIAAEGLRELELQHLDTLREAAMTVLEANHVTIQFGKVVRIGDEPIPDDGPVLQAIDRLVKIAARRAALLGLDAPAKVITDGTVRYEVVGVDPADLT